MNINRIKQIFTKAAKQIETIVRDQLPMENGPVKGPLLIRHGLVLRDNSVSVYRQMLDEIAALAAVEKTWSKDAVDDVLGESLAIILLGESEFDASLREEASKIVLRFREAPQEWDVALGIFGIAADCLGTTFGRITFGPRVYSSPVAITQMRISAGVETTFICAELKVKAVDRDTAVLQAGEIVDQHLAAINVLCSSGRPSRIKLRRTLDNSGQELSFREAKASGESEPRKGILTSIRTVPLRKEDLTKDFSRRGGTEVDALFRKSSELGEQLVAAFGLLGSAEGEVNRHTAFLLYAITLESLILGKDVKSELSMQLALRVAHLLVTNIETRQKLLSTVKKLYDLRSSIVHTGSTEVSQSELETIREIAFVSLLIIVTDKPFVDFSTRRELDDWFTTRLLESIE